MSSNVYLSNLQSEIKITAEGGTVEDQIRNVIDQARGGLYDWMKDWLQGHPKPPGEGWSPELGAWQNAFQAAWSAKGNEVRGKFGSALGNLGNLDWRNWDTINAMNPWAEFDGYVGRLDQYIWSDYSKPVPAPPPPKEGTDPKNEIGRDWERARDIDKGLDSHRGSLGKFYDKIKEWEGRITDLQRQIDSLPDGDSRKQAAQDALREAQKQLSTITNAAGKAEQALKDIDQYLKELGELASLANPNAEDARRAHELADKINGLASDVSKTLPSDTARAAVEAALVKVGTILASDPDEQPPPFRIDGESVYIDLSIFYSRMQGKFLSWWPEPVSFDQAKLDAYLTDFFDSLKQQGVKNIYLSFAQIGNIDALLGGKGAAFNDSVTQIFKDNYGVGNSGKNFFEYLTGKAHESGVKVSLSFGGELAGDSAWKINGDPQQQAQRLAEFMEKYGIDSVDWDIEASITRSNTPEALKTFFGTLHDELANLGKESIITILGSLFLGPKGDLGFLFADFDKYFDGCNLMLYNAGTQYYIDADNDSWGLREWLKHVSPDKLHIGFFDAVPYENPNASAGEKYPIPPGLSRGQAAGWVYLHVLEKLGLSADDMGAPFWWTTDPTETSNDQVMIDFWNYLETHSIQE